MPRGRLKNSKKINYYWTKEHDKLILEYNAIEDIRLKDRFFTKHLYDLVTKLAKEVLKYVNGKYGSNWSGEEQEEAVLEVITFLVTVLKNYKDESKSGYAYFGTIAKNHYLDILRRRTAETTRFVPFEGYDQEDEDGFEINVSAILYDVNTKEEIDNYIERIEEHIKSFKYIDSDTKLIFSEIIKYLNSEPVPDLNGIKTHLIREFVDKGIYQDWKIDRILAPYEIYFALKDRSDYRETKQDNLMDNNWEWIYEKDDQTEYQKERQRFFSRKNSNKDKRAEYWKKRRENETKEERELRLRYQKEYRELQYNKEGKSYRKETPEQRKERLDKARQCYWDKLAKKKAEQESKDIPSSVG